MLCVSGMPCLELNKIGKGVQKKCKYQKLRCYNGVKWAHCLTFLMRSFQEKLGGWVWYGGPKGRQGPPEHGKTMFACLRLQTYCFLMLWGTGRLNCSNRQCLDDEVMAVFYGKCLKNDKKN